MRRVAITGIGAICALGDNIDRFWDSLRAGSSAIRPIENVDVSKLRFRNGAEVRSFDAAQFINPKDADFLDRFAQFALIAANQAIQQSGLSFSPELRERTAIVTGSCVGGQSSQDAGFLEVYAKG